VTQVHQATSVLLAQLVIQASKAKWAQLAQLVTLGQLRLFLVQPVELAIKVTSAQLVQLVAQVTSAQPAQLVAQVTSAQPAQLVTQVQLQLFQAQQVA
jgi:hypothetical protein